MRVVLREDRLAETSAELCKSDVDALKWIGVGDAGYTVGKNYRAINADRTSRWWRKVSLASSADVEHIEIWISAPTRSRHSLLDKALATRCTADVPRACHALFIRSLDEGRSRDVALQFGPPALQHPTVLEYRKQVPLGPVKHLNVIQRVRVQHDQIGEEALLDPA